MTEANLQEDEPDPKRRKVRKGTRSCWECRRRKVSCVFASPANAVCDNCRRRGTLCVSQDHLTGPMLSTTTNQVEDRLVRVEGLIEHLVNNAGIAHAILPTAEETTAVLEDRGQSLSKVVSPKSNSAHTLDKEASTRSGPSLKPPSPAIAIPNVPDRQVAGKYEELVGDLVAAWPSRADLDLICTLPAGLSTYLYCGICTPYSSAMDWDPPSPREILQLPPPGSHPVLIARKLLVLGIFLQGVLPSSTQDLGDLAASYRDIMSRVVDRAIRLVTTNEDLVGSVEGIECIMIEAMYQNYAGNLHRAWMAVHRATAVAQMMALHRGLNSPSLKFLEPETRAAFNPDHICFRLVQMDGYLSLMLGLPQTSLEARFATPEALEGCHPIDRMQRIHCAVAGAILQRNDADVNNLAKTQEIDKLLQKAASGMPPQWWLMPNLVSSKSDGAELLHNTIRLTVQFTHYHLLTRLHLPYMLRSSSDRRYDHCKMTAVNVSRETLSRYVAFRTSTPAHFYCRGTDFLAFVATTVMCLAHIDSHSQCQRLAENPKLGTLSNSFAHSRPSDRGTMERTLEILESMTCDVIASKLARIIRHLLATEANAANGTIYSTSSSQGDEGELECDGKLTNGGEALRIYIPYFGIINFERGTDSKSTSTAPMQPELGIKTTSATDILLTDQRVEQNPQRLPSSDCSPACQIEIRPGYPNLGGPNSQIVGFQIGQQESPQQPSESNRALSTNNSNTEVAQLPVPLGLPGAEDDWDLQGIDVALFDSLSCATVIPDTVEEETWAQWAGMAENNGL